MNYFDSEKRIIEYFRALSSPSQTMICPESSEVIQIFESIRDEKKWQHWRNSSGKNSPPPDFYCDSLKVMMEVMRVDDHAFKDSNGRIINPVNEKESKIQRELAQLHILDHFPKADAILVNAVTDLPSDKDHNYGFYISNFERIIKKHQKHISLYKKNHPGYKLCFFVFDESSGYVQIDKSYVAKKRRAGDLQKGYIYLHFFDRKFVKVFSELDIDYLIWFSPFKYFKSDISIPLPVVCLYDIKKIDVNILKDYPEELIISTEV